jgi:cytoskeletal protein CcmA (bactofilin family)
VAARHNTAGPVRTRLCRLALLASFLLSAWIGSASGAVRTGTINDDVFLAGTSVDVYATVMGDLFAAAGWLNINSDVADNLVAAGGMADIAGEVQDDLIIASAILDISASAGDNLVAAGGVVTIDGKVGRKLFAAGGRLRLGPNAMIARDAWLAAGSAELAGAIGGDVVVAAGSVVLRGRIDGNVEATAFSLEVADGAVITGNVVFRGPEPPEVAPGAKVEGRIEHLLEAPADRQAAEATDDGWPHMFWLLITLGLGLLLDVILPRYLHNAGRRLVEQPFSCFGLGLAILVTTPVIIVVLIISVLGLAIGIAGIAGYGALLLLGPVVALFGLNDFVLARLLPAAIRSPARRRLAFIVALLLLSLLTRLPYVGTPLVWLVTVTGLGAATWQLYDSIRAEPARPYTPDQSEARE